MTKTIYGVLIPADDKQSIRMAPKPLSLEALQAAVGTPDLPGLIEAIDVNDCMADGNEDKSCTMYVNEEGGPDLLGLPVNSRASSLLFSMVTPPVSGVAEMQLIRGNVVLVGNPDDEGDDTPVPDCMVQFMCEAQMLLDSGVDVSKFLEAVGIDMMILPST